VVCRLQRHAACSSLNNTATPAAAASSLAPASPLQPLQAPLRDLRTASSLRFVVAAESEWLCGRFSCACCQQRELLLFLAQSHDDRHAASALSRLRPRLASAPPRGLQTAQ
jgi:hypothetical protein